MKKKKIYMYGAVTALLPIATFATIISCGGDNSKTDQNKMDGITMDMIKKALNITVDPGVLPSSVTQPSDRSSTLNGLDDVKITISAWNQNDLKGNTIATVAISKGSLTPPSSNPFTITWTGFKTETSQEIMDHITSEQIKTALNIIVDSEVLPSKATGPVSTTKTINGLDDIKITINTVFKYDTAGEITAEIVIFKPGLNSPSGNPFNITWSGYKIEADQEKLNQITQTQILTALSIDNYSTKFPTEFIPITKTTTINNLQDVKITTSYASWLQDSNGGRLSFTAILSKNGLTSREIFVSETGFKKATDSQDRLNTISNSQILYNMNPKFATPSTNISITTAFSWLVDKQDQLLNGVSDVAPIGGVTITMDVPSGHYIDNDTGYALEVILSAPNAVSALTSKTVEVWLQGYGLKT